MSNRVTKTTALILAILMVSGILQNAAAGEAQSLPVPEYRYKIEDDGTAVITAYLGQAETLTVPDAIDGHPVKAIGDNAFTGNTTLFSVTLPEGLASIGEYAFLSCENLAELILPQSLRTVGEYAFAGCGSLKDITLPLGVEELGVNPFVMTAVGIRISPDHPRYGLIDGLLVDKTDMKLISYPYGSEAAEYTIPEGILSIGDYAITSCDKLNTLTLPEGIVSLGEGAIYVCANLKDVYLPLSLSGMADNPFALTPVNIHVSPDHPNYEVIDGVLIDKREKTIITYPYGKEAGPYTVPDGVLGIEPLAFYYCSNLTAITLPAGFERIEKNTFLNCSGLASLTIAEGLKKLGDSAFYKCTQLSEAILPLSIEEIGFNPFEMSPVDVSISSDHPRFKVIDGVLFDQAEHRLITYPYGRENSEYTVPEQTLVIGDWAFSSCEKLTALTLPDGLETIADQAFSSCENLEELNVPASVTAIGDSAFNACPNLTLTLQPGSFADTWAHENDVQHMYGE